VYSRFQENPFFPDIPPGGFNFTADGTPVDVWPCFPGIKVGKLFISILPLLNFTILVVLIINRYV
jgi:hypothetical protein